MLVTFDTLRRDHVGAYAEREDGTLTPHFDALAAQGRLFENAFTPMPTTAPAHASILTGLYPRDHGIERNGDSGTPALMARALQHRLREGGYATGAFVTSAVFGKAMELGGFDHWDDPSQARRPGVEAAEAALAWLDVTPPPVFLWLHIYDPHSPYGSAQHKPAHFPVDLRRYGWVDARYYDDAAVRAQMEALYAEGVREADAALGSFLQGLAARGREPVLLVTADHGELFDEQLAATGFAYGHGSLLTEEVLRVPLLVVGPGVRAERIATAVSLRDVYTTLLAAADLRDGEAAAEGRVDLLRALPERRVVLAARRVFATKRGSPGLDERALAHVRSHAVAASDGTMLVVIGEDGTPLPEGGSDAVLRQAASVALQAEREARSKRRIHPLDSATRARLEELGYLE